MKYYELYLISYFDIVFNKSFRRRETGDSTNVHKNTFLLTSLIFKLY